MAKKEGCVANIEGGVAKKWKTVAKSANLLAKKKCIIGRMLRFARHVLKCAFAIAVMSYSDSLQ